MQAEKFIQKSNRWNHDGSIFLFSAQPIPYFVEHFFQNGNDGSFNVHQHLDFIIFKYFLSLKKNYFNPFIGLLFRFLLASSLLCSAAGNKSAGLLFFPSDFRAQG